MTDEGDYRIEESGVLGLDKRSDLSRREFRDLVDVVLAEWGFAREDDPYETDEGDLIWTHYNGVGDEEIVATFLGDEVGESAKYDYMGKEEVVDGFLFEAEDVADAALVLYDVSREKTIKISDDLSSKFYSD